MQEKNLKRAYKKISIYDSAKDGIVV